MFCTQCGSRIGDKHKYCGVCGFHLRTRFTNGPEKGVRQIRNNETRKRAQKQAVSSNKRKGVSKKNSISYYLGTLLYFGAYMFALASNFRLFNEFLLSFIITMTIMLGVSLWENSDPTDGNDRLIRGLAVFAITFAINSALWEVFA